MGPTETFKTEIKKAEVVAAIEAGVVATTETE